MRDLVAILWGSVAGWASGIVGVRAWERSSGHRKTRYVVLSYAIAAVLVAPALVWRAPG